VASNRFEPITDAEVASLAAAHGLFQKGSAVLASVNGRLDLLLPGLGGRLRSRADRDILAIAASTYASTGEFTAFAGPLVYGLMAVEGTAYWVVAVRPTWPSPDVAGRILRAADQGKLRRGWARPSSETTVLVARVRAASLSSHDETVGWLAARIEELGASGVLAAALG
jgi:hypothetical protein